jgi:hypothetical protein
MAFSRRNFGEMNFLSGNQTIAPDGENNRADGAELAPKGFFLVDDRTVSDVLV